MPLNTLLDYLLRKGNAFDVHSVNHRLLFLKDRKKGVIYKMPLNKLFDTLSRKGNAFDMSLPDFVEIR